MKGQQKASETEEGTVQIQEGAVATGEDPTSVAIASIQSAATFPDPNIKYVFRAENGGAQLMYRVIQVAEGQLDGQTEGSGAISGYPATQSMTQAVIQGAFTSEDAVDSEATATETHYTYYPATAVADTSTSAGAGTTAVVTTQNSDALLGQATPTGTGQFFVMMSPQEVLQSGGTQRSIAPRTHPYSPKSEAPRTTRDEKRRAQHNEVERRRRDKINNWIVQLSKIIPDCSMENTKSAQSKGGILSKACDYIQELRQNNIRLSEELQGLEQLQVDNEVLRQQTEYQQPVKRKCRKKITFEDVSSLSSPPVLPSSGQNSTKEMYGIAASKLSEADRTEYQQPVKRKCRKKVTFEDVSSLSSPPVSGQNSSKEMYGIAASKLSEADRLDVLSTHEASVRDSCLAHTKSPNVNSEAIVPRSPQRTIYQYLHSPPEICCIIQASPGFRPLKVLQHPTNRKKGFIPPEATEDIITSSENWTSGNGS